MDNVVSVMFKRSRSEFYDYALELPFATGEYVVVEVDKFKSTGLT